MDIRNFFGGKDGTSSLSRERKQKGSPSPLKKEKKRSVRITKEDAISLSSEESNGENPIPSSVRRKLRDPKVKRPKKIVLSSDDDDLPPSASQSRPLKAVSKSISEHQRTHKSASLPRLPTENAIYAKGYDDEESRISNKSGNDVAMESDEEEDFVPAPTSSRRKRGRTPPGQSKLAFSKKTTKTISREAATEKVQTLEKISASDFFKKQKRNDDDKDVEELPPKPSPEKRGNLLKPCSPRRSPRKTVEDSKPEGPSISKQKFSPSKSEKSKHHKCFEDTSSVDSPKRKKVSHEVEHGTNLKKISSDNEEAHHSNNEGDDDAEDFRKRKHHRHQRQKFEHGDEKELSHAKKQRISPEKLSDRKDKNSAVKSPKKFEGGKEKFANIHQMAAADESKSRSSFPEKKLKESPKKHKEIENDSGNVHTVAVNDDRKPTSQFIPWVDKYKPTSTKQLVGQAGEKSPMNKLLGWLRDWSKYHLGEGATQKRARPPPWLAQQDGSSFKAVLLSGPPGIGKTTCAMIACAQLGIDYVEMNASDVRNKKHLESGIAQLIFSNQIDRYFSNSPKPTPKQSEISHVLIMDEVDGMSGNEDRAGLAELIQLIKTTKIPIICICNDRQSQKMRSLVNYCFDIRFPRPRIEQIRARIQMIAFQEKLKLTKEQIDEVIEASNHDVRQTIYNLQLLSAGGNEKNIQTKDCAVNTFEAARRLLSCDTSMIEKQEMFFLDYSLMPLFVQENYPNIQSSKMSQSARLTALRKSAIAIANGDVIDRSIRTDGTWSLLNELAYFSSVLPSVCMNGHLKTMISFPSWLGKNSSATKRQRLMRQLALHTHLKVSADCHSLVTDYVPIFRDRLYAPLIEREAEGVSDVIAFYNAYDLTKDDAEAIAELAVWPGLKDLREKIPPKVKAALTRALNKEHRLLPYDTGDLSQGRKRKVGDPESHLEVDEEGNVVEVGEEDLLNVDDSVEDDQVLMKSSSQPNKKPTASQTGRGGSKSVRGGGRGGSRARGRGKGAKS